MILWLACWILALGMTVLRRSRRDDIGFVFLGTYFFLTAARVLYLGQPYPVIWHQWQSGALLDFCFLYDFRSALDSRSSGRTRRFCDGGAALIGFYLRFYRYNPNGLLYALFFLSPATLILDTLFKHSRYEWILPGTSQV